MKILILGVPDSTMPSTLRIAKFAPHTRESALFTFAGVHYEKVKGRIFFLIKKHVCISQICCFKGRDKMEGGGISIRDMVILFNYSMYCYKYQKHVGLSL